MFIAIFDLGNAAAAAGEAVVWTNSICVTPGVWNNSGWIDFHIGPYGDGCSLDWWVTDVVLDKAVASGRTSTDISRTIYGLTNAYSLTIKKVELSCGGEGIIENELP